MLKKIMKIIAAIYLAISFAVLFVFIYNWYFTAESRYVRDNLQYVSEQMEKHGIEVDDKNWNTIAKILQRNRAVYCPNQRLTNHKSSKHLENTCFSSQPQNDFVHLQ